MLDFDSKGACKSQIPFDSKWKRLPATSFLYTELSCLPNSWLHITLKSVCGFEIKKWIRTLNESRACIVFKIHSECYSIKLRSFHLRQAPFKFINSQQAKPSVWIPPEICMKWLLKENFLACEWPQNAFLLLSVNSASSAAAQTAPVEATNVHLELEKRSPAGLKRLLSH